MTGCEIMGCTDWDGEECNYPGPCKYQDLDDDEADPPPRHD